MSASPPSGLKPAAFIYRKGRSPIDNRDRLLKRSDVRASSTGCVGRSSVVPCDSAPAPTRRGRIARFGVFECRTWTWCMRFRPIAYWCTQTHRRCCRDIGPRTAEYRGAERCPVMHRNRHEKLAGEAGGIACNLGAQDRGRGVGPLGPAGSEAIKGAAAWLIASIVGLLPQEAAIRIGVQQSASSGSA